MTRYEMRDDCQSVPFKASSQRVFFVERDGLIRSEERHGKILVRLRLNGPDEGRIIDALQQAGCDCIRIWTTPSGRKGYLGTQSEGALINIRLSLGAHQRLKLLTIAMGVPMREVISQALRLMPLPQMPESVESEVHSLQS